jgi:hypothetical protein
MAAVSTKKEKQFTKRGVEEEEGGEKAGGVCVGVYTF